METLHSPTAGNQTNNHSKVIWGTALFLSLCLVVILMVVNNNLRIAIIQQATQAEVQVTDTQKGTPELSNADFIKAKEISYVTEHVLPLYPQLAEITDSSIVNVHAYSLHNVENESAGWLIETNGNDGNSYYLVSSVVQKELEDVMVPYAGENAPCTLTKVITTGNERGLGRRLLDKYGYIVIAGENCETYAGGSSVSVYSLSTGEKIKLTGDFDVAGTTWKGTTARGTATGNLVGVYGVTNPVIVVSYGDRSWKDTVEEVRQMAFFNLQTGKLIRVETFK